MKYILLIHGNPANWEHPIHLHPREPISEAEREEMKAQDDALLAEMSESGELVGGIPLAAPEATRTVRVRDGAVAVTDGPYLEVKEHLAGYFMVECDGVERAVEIAARFPDVRFGGVEVRPIMTSTGMEM